MSEKQETEHHVSAQCINWNPHDNLKNHILKGSKRKHIAGWKRFGIDPDDKNAWNAIVIILKEVLEKADQIQKNVQLDGSMYIKYTKTFIEQGVRVVFKIWIDPTGAIQKISDAIPYIID